MRNAVIALTVLAGVAAAPALADSAPATWTFSYDSSAGLATAVQTEAHGDVSTTFTCRPPNGDLTINDFELGRRRADTATVRIGEMTINVAARSDRVNGQRALIIPMPQSPPVLAAVTADAPMIVSVGGYSHTLARGAGQKLRDVAYACWPRD